MKKSIFFWAVCVTISLIILLAVNYIFLQDVHLNSTGNRRYSLYFFALRSIYVIFVFLGIISLFSKTSAATKGIILGALVTILIDFSFFKGVSFKIEEFKNSDTKVFEFADMIYIPLLFFITSIVFFVKRNFDLAKVFAFITVIYFAAFFLGMIAEQFAPLRQNNHYQSQIINSGIHKMLI